MSKEEKPIEDYRQSRPQQLELFQENPLADNNGQYCNLMEFYDLLPKYVDYTPAREAGKYLPILERQFMINGKEYRLSLQPARIKSKGEEKDCFPGKREELIEDALRKIAMDSGMDCMFFDGMIGLKFTLTQLRKELINRGCSAPLDKIKEALKVCAKSILEIKPVKGEGDEFSFISPLFPTLILNEREQYENGQKYCFVRFHPLVTKAIAGKSFRLYAYNIGMALKTVLSSYVFKRLSYNFTQAGQREVYKINLTTLVRDAGLDSSLPLWKNLQKFKRAVKELIDRNIVSSVEYEYKKEGNRTIEIVIRITVTDQFSAKIMKANFVRKELKNKH